MHKEKTPIQPLSLEKKALVKKIRKWAHIDFKKDPKEFNRLFNELWNYQHGKRR